MKKIIFIGSFMSLILMLCVMFYEYQYQILFYDNSPEIELYSDLELRSNIKLVRIGEIEDVVIDISMVDVSKVGKYPVYYQIQNYQYCQMIEVVDMKPPQFTISNLSIPLGVQIQASDFVSFVEDDSDVSIKFVKNYQFDTVGEMSVLIEVKDEFGNSTKKEAILSISPRDEQAPTIEGLDDLYLIQNSTVDYMQDIRVRDNDDHDPVIEYDVSQVDTSTIGSYIVTYVATDRSNNQTIETRNVYVVSNKPIGTYYQSQDKIIYLTFDDGPSMYTSEILAILKRYDALATFFVIGSNKEYHDLIKVAHDQGHTIGLHSYCHEYDYVYASSKNYFSDLQKISDLCKEQIGFIPHYIRFPGGSSNLVSTNYNEGIMSHLTSKVLQEGYQYYDWDCSSGDGEMNTSVEDLIKNATAFKDNNIMILFHDANGKEATVQALPSVIEYYQALGYRFMPITDNSYVPHHTVKN